MNTNQKHNQAQIHCAKKLHGFFFHSVITSEKENKTATDEKGKQKGHVPCCGCFVTSFSTPQALDMDLGIHHTNLLHLLVFITQFFPISKHPLNQ